MVPYAFGSLCKNNFKKRICRLFTSAWRRGQWIESWTSVLSVTYGQQISVESSHTQNLQGLHDNNAWNKHFLTKIHSSKSIFSSSWQFCTDKHSIHWLILRHRSKSEIKWIRQKNKNSHKLTLASTVNPASVTWEHRATSRILRTHMSIQHVIRTGLLPSMADIIK